MILMSLLGWLTGLPLGGIASDLKDAYVAHTNAQTNTAKIASEERISALQAIQQVQSAEAGTRVNAFFRTALAVPAVVYLWQVVVVDKIACPILLGQTCSTDDLSPNLWYYVMVVVGFYMVHWTVGAWKFNG